MVKRTLIILLLCLTLILINISFVIAGSNNEIIDNIYVNSSDDEYSYIEEVYVRKSEYILQSAIKLNNLDSANLKDMNELNFHKLYLPKPNINYYDEFQKSGSLKNIISDYYYMESLVYDNKDNAVSAFRIRKMPFYDDLITQGYEFEDETTQMIKEKEGKYILASQGLHIPAKWYEVINDPVQLESLVYDQLIDEKILNMSILNINAYHMYLILIEGESNEYGIPITYREDFLKLKNGKLYDIEDIVNSWNGYFSSDVLGGSGTVPTRNNEIVFIVLGLIGLIVLMVGIIVVTKFKRKNIMK